MSVRPSCAILLTVPRSQVSQRPLASGGPEAPGPLVGTLEGCHWKNDGFSVGQALGLASLAGPLCNHRRTIWNRCSVQSSSAARISA
jgi:hypothetical protein